MGRSRRSLVGVGLFEILLELRFDFIDPVAERLHPTAKTAHQLGNLLPPEKQKHYKRDNDNLAGSDISYKE